MQVKKIMTNNHTYKYDTTQNNFDYFTKFLIVKKSMLS